MQEIYQSPETIKTENNLELVILIQELIKTTPNDMELGDKVRKLFTNQSSNEKENI